MSCVKQSSSFISKNMAKLLTACTTNKSGWGSWTHGNLWPSHKKLCHNTENFCLLIINTELRRYSLLVKRVSPGLFTELPTTEKKIIVPRCHVEWAGELSSLPPHPPVLFSKKLFLKKNFDWGEGYAKNMKAWLNRNSVINILALCWVIFLKEINSSYHDNVHVVVK